MLTTKITVFFILLCGLSCVAQTKYTAEDISKIEAFEDCFTQLSKPEPHKTVHSISGDETVTTIDRTDFKNHRFLSTDPDYKKLNIGLVDKSGLRYSDSDIEAMLNDQFTTGPGFHLNAHGVTDEHGNPIGIQMDGKVLNAEQVVGLIMQTLDDFNIVLDAKGAPFPIVLHTCYSGKGDDDSFAAEVSRLMTEKIANSTVIAADDAVYAAVLPPDYYEESVGADQNHENSQRPWKIFKNGKTQIGSKSYKSTMAKANSRGSIGAISPSYR